MTRPTVGHYCEACDERIVWLTHEKTGKPAPIDAVPDPKGNVVADFDAGTYRIAREDEGARYTNHFATCPHAAKFRKV